MAFIEGLSEINFEDRSSNSGTTWTALPEGEYECKITGSELKETKASQESGARNAFFLELDVEVVNDPLHSGTLLKNRLNIVHPKADTARWAKEKFLRLAHAIGGDRVVSKIQSEGSIDTAELHGRNFVAFIQRKKANSGYGDAEGFQNEFGAYKALEKPTSEPEARTPSQEEADRSIADSPNPWD